jgi:hypothetical protein
MTPSVASQAPAAAADHHRLHARGAQKPIVCRSVSVLQPNKKEITSPLVSVVYQCVLPMILNYFTWLYDISNM